MILPMKKATIFAMRRDRQALLLELQRASVLMITENDGSVRDEKLAETAAEVQSSADALRFVKRYGAKPGFFEDLPTVDYDEFIRRKEESETLAQDAARIESEMASVEGEISAAKSALEQYDPWLPLEIPLNELHATQTCAVHTGYIPSAAADRLAELEELGAYVQLLAPAAGSTACLIVCHKSADGRVMEAAKPFGFIEAAPPAAETTARAAHDALNAQIESARARLSELAQQAAQTGARIREIEQLCDQLNADLQRRSVPFNETESTFYIQGWVPENRLEDLEEAIHYATDVYDLVVEDPAEDEKPPTLVKNNKLVTPFERYVQPPQPVGEH